MKYFKLFSSCIPVKGAKRIVICDIQRGELYFISEGTYDFLTEYDNVPIDDIKAQNEPEIESKIEETINFLIENELGFITEEPNKFPGLDLEWESPSLITNAIIEHETSSTYEFKAIFDQLTELGCKFLEIRFYDGTTDLDMLHEIFNHLEDSIVNSVNLIVKYSPEIDWDRLQMFIYSHPRLSSLIIHSAPSNEIKNGKGKERLNVVKQKITDNSCCGNISPRFFSLNMDSFLEAQNFNSCLNRKVTITSTGSIKNCPSTNVVFGNIEKDLIKDVIVSEKFKTLWEISKDQIAICKDCEFRYICHDCRAFLKNANDIFSKPLKCAYDPYKAEWKTELSEDSKNGVKNI